MPMQTFTDVTGERDEMGGRKDELLFLKQNSIGLVGHG
jgi:hypothetical protein